MQAREKRREMEAVIMARKFSGKIVCRPKVLNSCVVLARTYGGKTVAQIEHRVSNKYARIAGL